jgi:hypothetical protein
MINSQEAVLHYERIERLADHLGIKADDLVEHLEDGGLTFKYGLGKSIENLTVNATDAWWCFRKGETSAAINVRTGVIIDGSEVD